MGHKTASSAGSSSLLTTSRNLMWVNLHHAQDVKLTDTFMCNCLYFGRRRNNCNTLMRAEYKPLPYYMFCFCGSIVLVSAWCLWFHPRSHVTKLRWCWQQKLCMVRLTAMCCNLVAKADAWWIDCHRVLSGLYFIVIRVLDCIVHSV